MLQEVKDNVFLMYGDQNKGRPLLKSKISEVILAGAYYMSSYFMFLCVYTFTGNQEIV